jgi:hypothetical protein
MSETIKIDLDTLLGAMKTALRRAAIADPAAAREVALDLSEVSFLEDGRNAGDETKAMPSIVRAARTMVKIRARFNGDVPGLPVPKDIDGPIIVKETVEAGEEVAWTDEVGTWAYTLDCMYEHDSTFINGAMPPWLRQLRQWLHDYRDACLKPAGGR